MPQRLDYADSVRRKVAPCIAQKRKAALGQFMTPSSVARFMASMFPPSNLHICRLLDAGAGVGALSCAFLDRWKSGGFGFQAVEAFAYEVDDTLRARLAQQLASYPNLQAYIIGGDFIELTTKKISGDFIELAARGVPFGQGCTHAILNPPYRKINTNSAHRLALRTVGVETVNLYTAFVALAVAMADPGGQIVAIIPRSFCNGPYYKPFRKFILERAAIHQMHLFESRSKAFKNDEVLQENVILRLERGGKQGMVTVSTSTDDSFCDLVSHKHPFDRIVFPNDPERFIHVPTSTERSAFEDLIAVLYSFSDLGVKVSTGPIVDFRMKEHLRDVPEPGTVPLLYPAHFNGNGCEWPKLGIRKPNAIQRNEQTEGWLYPNGFYCVVRRFSSKEEKRRIMASVVDPSVFNGAPMLGLENHLNVFHEKRHGLPEALARGLAAFLNSTAIDEQFRRFSGHTQVNATDLKLMKYPSRKTLIELGKWSMKSWPLTQSMIDKKVESLAA